MQEQKVHREEREVQYGCSTGDRNCVDESDTGTSCFFLPKTHLSAYCQMETYGRKESTIRKGLEITYESDYYTLWIFSQIHKCRGITYIFRVLKCS